MLWFKGKCPHIRVETKQLLFHPLIFVSFYFFFFKVLVYFEMQDGRPDRKCFLILISLPTWSDLKKICAELYVFSPASSSPGTFMGLMLWLYQVGFANLIPYGVRIPITLARDTLADLLPRVWKAVGFEKGIAEEKLGKSQTGYSRYFWLTWLERQIFLG